MSELNKLSKTNISPKTITKAMAIKNKIKGLSLNRLKLSLPPSESNSYRINKKYSTAKGSPKKTKIICTKENKIDNDMNIDIKKLEIQTIEMIKKKLNKHKSNYLNYTNPLIKNNKNIEEKYNSVNASLTNKNIIKKIYQSKVSVSPRDKSKKDNSVSLPSKVENTDKKKKEMELKLSINKQNQKKPIFNMKKKMADIVLINPLKKFPQTSLNSRKNSNEKLPTKNNVNAFLKTSTNKQNVLISKGIKVINKDQAIQSKIKIHNSINKKTNKNNQKIIEKKGFKNNYIAFQKLSKLGILIPSSITTPITRDNSKNKFKGEDKTANNSHNNSLHKYKSKNNKNELTKSKVDPTSDMAIKKSAKIQSKQIFNKIIKSNNKDKDDKHKLNNKHHLCDFVISKSKLDFNNILKKNHVSTLDKLIINFNHSSKKDGNKSNKTDNKKLFSQSILKTNNSKQISKKKLRNISLTKMTFLQENQSQLSTVRDCNYYQKESEHLANKIKEYFKVNRKYPKSDISFYKIGRIIGRGAFGKVNIGLNILTGRIVAIKSFNKTNITNDNAKNKIIYETNLMKHLRHPCITKILETFECDKYIFIIMEYIGGGNLQSFVKKRRKLTEKTAKYLFKQIMDAINYMHSQNICHRDIKLENILIDLSSTIKICDFGVGKFISKDNLILQNQCGTPVYMAPEIFKGEGYIGYPVDIWSAGVSLYLMLTGNIPFNRTEQTTLQYEIMNSPMKPIEEDISNECMDLIYRLLEKDPKKRITSQEVLEHPWLSNEDINYNNNRTLNNHLFTNAEMLLLQKTHIDYRKGKIEDLGENFTMKNLITSDDYNHINNNSKSIILAPYNTMNSMDYIESEKSNNKKGLENLDIVYNIIKFCGKVREYNMNYELNNNEEIDNGVLINSKYDQEHEESDGKNYKNSHSDIIDKNKAKSYASILRSTLSSNKNNSNCSNIYDNKSLVVNDYFVQMVVDLGFKRDYVKKCIDRNELNQATAAYYLFSNYENIK